MSSERAKATCVSKPMLQSRRKQVFVTLIFLTLASLAGCGDQATLPLLASFGSNPTLPPPSHTLIPTLNIAPAKGWAPGETPTPAPGFTVTMVADELDHPRNVFVLPNGDVLVAETNAPPRPDDTIGIRGLIQRLVMRWAGAGGPSANRITLLGSDDMGQVKTRTVFLEGLNSPFGMALIGHDFYVANTDAVLRFPYQDGQTTITAPGTKVADLPGGLLNHHWTKARGRPVGIAWTMMDQCWSPTMSETASGEFQPHGTPTPMRRRTGNTLATWRPRKQRRPTPS
jgi:glucose/arabinose dehydrogenase